MLATIAMLAGASLAGVLLGTLLSRRSRRRLAARHWRALARALGVEGSGGGGEEEAQWSRLEEVACEQHQLALASRRLNLQLHVQSEEVQRLGGLLDELPDGLLVLGEGEHIAFANRRAREHLGLEELTGISLEETAAPGSVLAAIRSILASESGSGGRRARLELTDGDGRMRTYRVRGISAEPPIVIFEDITKEESSARMQTEFVYSVSHELKTPLTAIQASLEMLVEEENLAEEDRARLVEVSHSEALRLSQMIRELLDLARVEAGVTRLKFESLPALELLEELRARHAPLAERKHQRLLWEVTRYPPVLHADRALLGQALMNVLGNAIKYTPEGGQVAMRASLEGEEFVLEVRDRGIGIAIEELPHIFERFYRSREARNSRIAGTGLGLALARFLIEAHGGTIEVASILGEGSTFTVHLPIAAGHPREETVTFKVPEAFSGKGAS